MEKPDLNKLSKKVKDYIYDIEKKAERLEAENTTLKNQNPVSSMYLRMDNAKIYLPEGHAVYFDIDNGNSFDVSLRDVAKGQKGLKIYLYGGDSLSIKPCGGVNCVDLVPDIREGK